MASWGESRAAPRAARSVRTARATRAERRRVGMIIGRHALYAGLRSNRTYILHLTSNLGIAVDQVEDAPGLENRAQARVGFGGAGQVQGLCGRPSLDPRAVMARYCRRPA